MGDIAAASKEIARNHQTGGFEGLLERSWPRISSVMPKHMSAERMFQLALSAYNQTPGLAQCTP